MNQDTSYSTITVSNDAQVSTIGITGEDWARMEERRQYIRELGALIGPRQAQHYAEVFEKMDSTSNHAYLNGGGCSPVWLSYRHMPGLGILCLIFPLLRCYFFAMGMYHFKTKVENYMLQVRESPEEDRARKCRLYKVKSVLYVVLTIVAACFFYLGVGALILYS